MQNQSCPPYNPQADYCLRLSSSSTARADGIDKNSAVATLSAYGNPLCGYNLTFCLSGSAVFCDGSGHYSAVTDGQGQATVYFSDHRQESVTVSCRFENISALSYSTFAPPVEITALFIVAAAERNYAPADNLERNAILYTLMDSDSGLGVSGRQLNFSIISGAAVLDNSFGNTDPSGQTRVTLHSGVPDAVEVRAILENQAAINNYTVVSFSPPVTYIISAEPLTSNVSAGGTHQIRYTLRNIDGSVVQGALMSFSSSSPAAIPTPGMYFTSNQGQITVSITSAVPVTAIIHAEYAMGNAENNTAVTFL